MLRFKLRVLAGAIGIVIAVQSGGAAVKVRANFDKAFDFKQARTWAWNTEGPGNVIVARTPDDDPVDIKRRAEPLIMKAVSEALPGRGLKPAVGSPDLTVTYYLLLTFGVSRQTLGQFLPAVSQWGLPPFAPATTALEAIEEGSLVLDLSAKGQVVWRGIGEAQLKWEFDQEKRTALLLEAVREVLERYPPNR